MGLSDLSKKAHVLAAVRAYEQANEPIAPGDPVRMDHEGCPAGRDERRRLYLTAKCSDDGRIVYLAFCHNCGAGGAATGGATARRAAGAHESPPIDVPHLPTAFARWAEPGIPGEARAWVNKALTDAEADSFGFGWDMDAQRVIVPAYDEIRGEFNDPALGKFLGYQSRRIFGTRTPKYLTSKGPDPLEMILDFCASPMCVVVEDWLSAAVLAKEFPVATVPLLGGHMRPEFMKRIMADYKHIVVWLDNDNPQIRETRDYIARLARVLGAGSLATICSALPDPKNLSPAQREEYMRTI